MDELSSKDFAESIWEYLIKFSIKQTHRLSENIKQKLSFNVRHDGWIGYWFLADVSYDGVKVLDLAFLENPSRWRLKMLGNPDYFWSDSPFQISEQMITSLQGMVANATP